MLKSSKMVRYFAVLVGGAAGSLLRYVIGVAIMTHYAGPFPLGTFIINVTGSFLIGFALAFIPDSAPVWLRPLFVTGMLGGYTTFSSFEWETLMAPFRVGALYAVTSVALGLLACWCGAAMARLAH